MTTVRSGGILLFRRSAEGLQVLLAHPGGPYFAKRDTGCWTIPKGQPNGEADLLVVAEREFGEETGHPIESVRHDGARPLELGTITLASGKVVHGWAIEGDLDPAAVASNDFEIEWPPRSGHRARFPEVDRVAWLDPVGAREKIHPAQAAFIDRLEALLEGR